MPAINSVGIYTRSIVAATALALAGCSEPRLEVTILREFAGQNGEKVTESLYWEKGKEQQKHRQVEVAYKNGVQIRAVDFFSDGTIDHVFVTANPNEILIAINQEYLPLAREIPGSMQMPPVSELESYFSK